MKTPSALLVLVLAAACGAPGAPRAPGAPCAPALEPSVHPGINDNFLAPDLDVEHYVETFEGESREIAAARDAIVAAIGLRPGDDVADVGSGTGLFLAPISRAVGPDGVVYALDIAAPFVEHMEQRARDEGLANVRPRLCAEDSVLLPRGSIDVAFVCDTYHHFEFPHSTLASLHEALRPGGRLVIVDFERIPGTSREWVLDHVRAGKAEVVAEIEAGGFELQDEPEVPGLSENYLVRFRRR